MQKSRIAKSPSIEIPTNDNMHENRCVFSTVKLEAFLFNISDTMRFFLTQSPEKKNILLHIFMLHAKM